MIDISHQHARRILRRSFDGRIPEEQWAAVQSHLENCAECRAYRATLNSLEREARKVLRSHWEGLQGPNAQILPAVLASRHRRSQTRRISFGMSASLLTLAVFWFFGGIDWLKELFAFAPPPQPASQVQEEVATALAPLATAQPGLVQALVAFSARPDPQADSNIYLMNPPEAPVALIESSANEIQPAWSPDGAWIAYLSDQSGKTEVYLSGLTGEDPIQLTSEPDIEWHGPLSFSPDGSLLALTGVRVKQGNQPWIYTVPTSGGAPVALPGTRGGWGPEFSPAGGRLGFTIIDAENHGAAVYYFQRPVEALRQSPRHWTAPAGQGAPIGKGVFHFQPASAGFANLANPALFQAGIALDWSPDGNGLAYIGSQTETQGGGGRVMVEREMDYATSLQDDYQLVSQIAQAPVQEAFRSVAFTPTGAVLFLETMDPAQSSAEIAADCWTIQMRAIYSSARKSQGRLDPQTAGNLCVESGLDSSSWTPDGNWLIVVGRSRLETDQALYAVRMPGIFDNLPLPTNTPEIKATATAAPAPAIRLSALGGLFNSGQITGAPRVRPAATARESALHPVPASPPEDFLHPPADIHEAPGEIVYSIRNNQTSLIVRARPDGSSGRVLLANPGTNRCPRFSPDGEWVAFVSNFYPAGNGGGSDLSAANAQPSDGLFKMRTKDGTEMMRLSSAIERPAGFSPTQSLHMDCPVWSPDGQRLASVLSIDDQDFLAITPASLNDDSQTETIFLPVGQPTGAPSWTSEGSILALAHRDRSGKAALLTVRLRVKQVTASRQQIEITTRNTTAPLGLDFASGPVITNDGWRAFLLSNSNHADLGSYTMLRRLSLDGSGERMPIPLGADLPAPTVPGALASLPNFQVGVLLRGGVEDRYKSFIHTFDLRSNTFDLLAALEDETYSAVWSPDGNWVLLNAESGLWAVNIWEASQYAPLYQPIWLSPEPISDMDWQTRIDPLNPNGNDPKSREQK